LKIEFIISFNPSDTQLVEEIPVKLHLTGKSRLTVQFNLPSLDISYSNF